MSLLSYGKPPSLQFTPYMHTYPRPGSKFASDFTRSLKLCSPTDLIVRGDHVVAYLVRGVELMAEGHHGSGNGDFESETNNRRDNMKSRTGN